MIATLRVSLLALFFGSIHGQSVEAQDKESFEKRVLALLVGEGEATSIHGLPAYWEILKLGDPAIEVMLKHASDSDRASHAVCKTLFHFAWQRMELPAPARALLKTEIARSKPNPYAVRTVGLIGDTESLPRLVQLAKGEEERLAATAVLALSYFGTDVVCKELERLPSECKTKTAAEQCSVVLKELYHPFLGDGAEARLLNAIESDEVKPFKISFGKDTETVHVWNTALLRFVYTGRKDLAPVLRRVATRLYAKDPKAVETLRLRSILVAIHRLGGEISQDEKKVLASFGGIDSPQ